MEYSEFLNHMSRFIPLAMVDQNFREFLRQSSDALLYDYADQLLLNLPYPREDAYSSDNFDTIQKKVTQHVNSFLAVT